ncbi:MAG: hypothetical protein J7498_05605 [Sphingobium sp.]|nr:hypothetical protein [Sphingobium sp.]
MTKFTVDVTQRIEVELDAEKFDDAFMEEFRASFYPFDTIEDHAQHLAQLHARGLVDWLPSFIEGYGPSNDMGINLSSSTCETEIVDD